MRESKTQRDKVALRWLQGVPDEQKDSLRSAILNDTLVLGRLNEIIDEEIESLQAKEIKVATYDSPSWAYKQAHYNGVRQTLYNLKFLLSFLDR